MWKAESLGHRVTALPMFCCQEIQSTIIDIVQQLNKSSKNNLLE